ncbi:hypothetical protein CCACVL1_21868 [Corchorus capsularis]|uniref:Uncharacterized protein n=1 Tax=Corchorus capsularis TaxID=210143 RepID=A0A1R3H220_COCAP|nr:hypothetical protein CCACVL1_21868 [Corchorus capsularis]
MEELKLEKRQGEKQTLEGKEKENNGGA